MRYIVSRVSNKSTFEITTVEADSYEIEPLIVDPIPLTRIHFHTSTERFWRKPVLGRVASMILSGDFVVETETDPVE
jgi:hypothetical protein